MTNQRGGAFTVRTLIGLAILATALGAASRAVYLDVHRTLEINCPELTAPYPLHRKTGFELPHTQIKKKPADEFSFHTFPEGRNVCTGFDTICWIRI
jgi:hypothetical protein